MTEREEELSREEVERLPADCTLEEFYALKETCAALRARAEALELTLGFYADASHFDSHWHLGDSYGVPVLVDGGRRAREALAAPPATEGED